MLITPKQATETVTVSIRFPKPLLDQVDAYCRHLGGASDRSHVIVEAVRITVERDRDFQKTLRRPSEPEAPPAPGSAASPARDAAKKPPVPARPGAPTKEAGA